MRLLFDANLSPRIVSRLRQEGHDVVHVADLDLLAATGTRRSSSGRRRRTGSWSQADTDFPMLLAVRGASGPSVVLLRGVSELPPDRHADLLVANLPTVTDALERGAIVSLRPDRLRIRELPITPGE